MLPRENFTSQGGTKVKMKKGLVLALKCTGYLSQIVSPNHHRQKDMLKSEFPISRNVILFGNRDVADVTKLR